MHDPTDETLRQLTHAITLLTKAVEDAERRRLAQSRRRTLVALLVSAALLVTLGVDLVAQPRAPAGMPLPAIPGVPGAGTEHKETVQLTPQEQAKLAEFRQRLAKARTVLAGMSQEDAGAAMALFLADVADSLTFMPRIHAEMQVMNHRMSAMPVMAMEMHELSGKIGLMTAGIDSSMGRMGRWMSWWPW
jgi:hypothetical protein